MNYYIALTFSFLLLSSFNAFAKPLPPLQAPRELSEVNSEFAEGTITRLSEADISQFLPWAQNAQSVLTKALRDIETMPVDQQVRHLTAIIKSVVQNSGQKNYQMFMRFALNRTLLLVQELTFQADWNIPGTAENVLDLQVKGINLALKFYESDLAYQNRANRGNDTVNLNYGMFGAEFGKTIFLSIQNITDASAQYRLLYKTLEMINWDFSRDALAVDFSDTIVEIYNTLNSMNEIPDNTDLSNVQAIRRLNMLLRPIQEVERIILLNNEQTRRELIERDQIESEVRRQQEIELQFKNGISVVIGYYFFVITGSDHQERFAGCISKYPSNVKEITFSHGNHGIKYFHKKDGFWSAVEGCKMILSELDSLPRLKEQSFNVYGMIEQTPYKFTGTTIGSLLYQCYKMISPMSNVHEISVGVNNKTPVSLRDSYWSANNNYYWSKPKACYTLLNKAIQLGN